MSMHRIMRDRHDMMVAAPPQEHLQVGVGVGTGQALVPGQVRGDRHPKQIVRTTVERNRICHTPTVPGNQPHHRRQNRAFPRHASDQPLQVVGTTLNDAPCPRDPAVSGTKNVITNK
jgi:hypothetical protein